MQNNREDIIMLLDYYSNLLTNHQIEIMSDYYNDDLSMNEIADNYSISKSAVQDLIKRTISQLNDYEKKLKLIDKDKKLYKIILEMQSSGNDTLVKYANKIEKTK